MSDGYHSYGARRDWGYTWAVLERIANNLGRIADILDHIAELLATRDPSA